MFLQTNIYWIRENSILYVLDIRSNFFSNQITDCCQDDIGKSRMNCFTTDKKLIQVIFFNLISILCSLLLSLLLLLLLIRVFHISLRWWSFTGDWMTASLLKSPGLFSVFWLFNNAVVWMVSTRPPTSKSFRPFNNPLATVPKAPIPIGIIVTLMFHSFSNSLARSRYLSLFSHSFSFILWSAGTAKSTILQIFCFFVDLLLLLLSLLLLLFTPWEC